MAAQPGRRGARVLIAVALLLAGLLVVDRVGVYLSEQALGRQARAELAHYSITTADDPAVRIAGFPFLTQVVAGDYREVTIVAHDLSGNGLRLAELKLVATGVHASLTAMTGSGGTVTADHLAGTVTISWPEVSSLLPLTGVVSGQVQARPVDADHVQLIVPVTTDLGTYQLDLTGGVAIDAGQPTVTIGGATVHGSGVPAPVLALVRGYAGAHTYTLAVPALPYGLRLTGLHADADGVVLSATSAGVPIALGR